MNKPFKILRNRMSIKAQEEAAIKTQKMIQELPLQELRQAKHLSQERMAEILFTKQANISRLERRTDMYISTLRSYIEAMGGQLDIVAKFPEGDVHIAMFSEIDVLEN